MTKRLLVCVLAAILVLPVLATAAEEAPAPKYGKEVGQALKPFDLPQVDGKNVNLESLKGRKTFLIFMQSSCTQCRDEIKTVNGLYDSIKDKVNVVAVGVDIDPTRLTQYKTAYNVKFPILLDPEYSVPNSLGVRGTPATVVLDKDGMIEQKIIGGIGQGEVEELFGKP